MTRVDKPKPIPQETNKEAYRKFTEATKPTTRESKKGGQRPPAQPAKKKT